MFLPEQFDAIVAVIGQWRGIGQRPKEGRTGRPAWEENRAAR
jgi:hypothetical protein